MAKQRKLLPARRRRPSQPSESILLRSAESLGRVIGTLQRQLDGARHHLHGMADDSDDPVEDDPPPRRKTKTATRSPARAPRSTSKTKRSSNAATRRPTARRTRNAR